MICVYCGEDQVKIIDTRSGPDEVIRKRKCLVCGKKFYTREKYIMYSIGARLSSYYKKPNCSR